MDVVSTGALPVASFVWQRNNETTLTVVCKTTYELRPGESPLAAEQEDLFEDDNPWDDDKDRSLYSASDLAPMKPRADVLVVGHAFAPRGAPVRSLIARLAVAGIDKSIELFCDRAWSSVGFLREGAPFARMQLRYERAAGGPGTWNPVGVRPDAPDKSGSVPIPNLVPPGTSPKSREGRIEPIGFGPIAPWWPERLAKGGQKLEAWSPTRWQPAQLPPDVAPDFWSAAPADQQVAAIRGDERIALENLHPEHPHLVTRLAGRLPRGYVEREGGAAEEIKLTCDTLWIDTDRGILTLTWRSQIKLAHAAEPGRVVLRLDDAPPRGYEPAAGEPEERTAALSQIGAKIGVSTAELPSARPGTVALSAAEVTAGRVLPFQSPPGASPAPVAPPALVQGGPGAAIESPWAAPPALRIAPPDAEPAPPSVPFTPPSVRLPPAVRPQSAEVVSLVWFDPPCVPRLSRRPAWRALLDKLEAKPPDLDVDDQVLGQPSTSIEDRRDVFEVLARGELTDADGISAALFGAMREDGKFTPPLLLLGGELCAVFDEFAALRATVASVTPFIGGDPVLQAAVDGAVDISKTPGIEEASGVLEGLLARVRQAFGQGKRGVTWKEVEAQVERTLLEQRRYQRRTVFGQRCLRALLALPGSHALVPAYLPEDLAGKLPMFLRTRARLIAEAHTRQDQHEPHEAALRVLAVGHVLPPIARR
jgi:hypothetical protein